MPDKRFIHKEIYHSKRFLELPAETRDMYTYMTLNCDDDGICNVYEVARLAGIPNYQGHLHLLMSVGLTIQLEKIEEIYYLNGWQQLNNIPSIYKVDSPYLYLLTEKLPDVKITKSSRQLKKEKDKAAKIDEKKKQYGLPLFLQECDVDT